MNKLLFRCVESHTAHVKEMGSLSEKNIPRLREKWKKTCTDIMQGAPDRLPPLREINHKIPLVDEKMWYNYHLLHCAKSARKPLTEKIKKYTKAGWWRPARAEQAASMLVIPKKSGLICMVINMCRRNNNMVKDVTPFPDQDLIQLDVTQAKICSKLDFSDAYKQVRVEPVDVWKTAFTMVQGVYESLVMQQGDCNVPSMFQWLMNYIFQDYIGIFMHAYLDDLFVFSNSIEEHQHHLKLVLIKFASMNFSLRRKNVSSMLKG